MRIGTLFPSTGSILTESSLYSMIANDLFGGTGPVRDDRIGVEVELLPLWDDGGELRMVPLRSSVGQPSPSLVAWLGDTASTNKWDFATDEFDNIRIDLPDGGKITLEPAGQLEYSSPALASYRDVTQNLHIITDVLEASARTWGISLRTVGFNNLCDEDSLTLQINKPRYQVMDAHFASIGEFGQKMMRATCALQINLDFGDRSELADRWRLANMIAPSINAIFANSGHTHRGKSYRSFRYEIWRQADPTRTGRLYDRPDLDPVADYMRFALDATVMMIAHPELVCTPPPQPMTFREWMGGIDGHRAPTAADWQLHLTTLFPDVRPRGWMEIRSIDCLPRKWWGVAVAVVSTLIYHSELRESALGRLEQRERLIDPTEHEHGGAWQSDFETGMELLEMALPFIAESDVVAQCREYREQLSRS